MSDYREDSPLITHDENHDINASSVVTGQGDATGRTTKTTLSSDINPPNINGLDRQGNPIRQETGRPPQTVHLPPQAAVPYCNRAIIERRNRKRRRYTTTIVIIIVLTMVLIALTEIPIHLTLSSFNHARIYNYNSLPEQQYTVVLDYPINGFVTKAIDVLHNSKESLSSIGVWLLSHYHTNWTTINATIPLSPGYITNPVYVLQESNISIDINNTNIDNDITIKVHRLGYNKPYCNTRYDPNIVPIHFNCLIRDNGFYEVYINTTSGNNANSVNVTLHIKGIDITNDKQSCLLTQSKMCHLHIPSSNKYHIILSFSELTDFNINVFLYRCIFLYFIVAGGVVFIATLLLLYCCYKRFCRRK